MEHKSSYKTKQRDIVLNCIINNKERHFTADELIEMLKKSGTPVGKSTVYRYLNVLEADGTVRKYVSDDSTPACFQYSKDECSCTYHLKCNKCDILFHADDNITKLISDNLSALYNFRLDSTKIMFYGICQSCEAKGI